MKVRYKPSFIRDFKKLPIAVQTEAHERIALFTDRANHKQLKVHKLKGKLSSYYSFSVTYAHRIVFMYESNDTVVFLAIGTHDVYR